MSHGKIAVYAANQIHQTPSLSPIAAWNLALSYFNMCDKACPKTAWLGLCVNGNVLNVPAGRYFTTNRQRLNDLRAIAIRNLIYTYTPTSLPQINWQQICVQAGTNVTNADQGVIDVVISLFMAGLLV